MVHSAHAIFEPYLHSLQQNVNSPLLSSSGFKSPQTPELSAVMLHLIFFITQLQASHNVFSSPAWATLQTLRVVQPRSKRDVRIRVYMKRKLMKN